MELATRTPWEDFLEEALGRLEPAAQADLARAIGKPDLDLEWFRAEPEVVEAARSWVNNELDQSPSYESLPEGIFRVRGAIYVYRKAREKFGI